ncbi:hypothetical protein L484_008003 [Morus notabilis]|uniref:Uncharacterized protein n=1 Tax=Morus notabilis TaxID=981085 RepID=W9QKW1_9ROSA|nr:hypothetical protein L484_008003 [Morus notabilis]
MIPGMRNKDLKIQQVIVAGESTEETWARPLGSADGQAAAYGRGGMKTSGNQGRRIRKQKKNLRPAAASTAASTMDDWSQPSGHAGD